MYNLWLSWELDRSRVDRCIFLLIPVNPPHQMGGWATPQDSAAAPSGIHTFQLGIAELFAQPGDIAQLSAEHIRDKKVQPIFLYRATGALSPKGHAHSFVRSCYQSPRAPLSLLSHRTTIRADPGPSGLEGPLQQPPPGNANKKRVEKIKSLLSLWPFV